MDEKKQIEEMVRHCPFYKEGKCMLLEAVKCDANCDMCDFAKRLYNADFRKQSEGEWIWKKKIESQAQNRLYCSVCDDECLAKNNYYVKSNFCPNCGAKMKGGAE